jgi:hypothetical protein
MTITRGMRRSPTRRPGTRTLTRESAASQIGQQSMPMDQHAGRVIDATTKPYTPPMPASSRMRVSTRGSRGTCVSPNVRTSTGSTSEVPCRVTSTPAFPREEDQLLAGFRPTPADASGTSDHPHIMTRATAMPRAQLSYRARADDCMAPMMRKSNRARRTSDAALLLPQSIGLLVCHDLDHANAPVLAIAPVVAASRARLGLRRSGASPRAGGVSCRSLTGKRTATWKRALDAGRNCSAGSAAQLVACVDASFLTARQLRRILRERRRDPRPAAWKATLAAVRGEPRQFQRRLPRD